VSRHQTFAAGSRVHPVALSFALVMVVALTMPPAVGAVDAAVNGKIAFESNRDGPYQIYLMNADGSGETRLASQADDRHPAWSPDGTQIAFSGTQDGTVDIYVMNADGSGRVRLTTDLARDEDPAWSPDGLAIVFTSNRDGDDEIFVMDADGSTQTQLTSNTALDYRPAWSPGGTTIAFTSTRDLDNEVYVMNPDGTDQTRLTEGNGSDSWSAAWSPDGTTIAFLSDRDSIGDVYLMNADGSAETALTSGAHADDFAPAWSPDGTKLAFTSFRDRNFDIYSINANGSGESQLTSSSSWDGAPAWQRVSPQVAFTAVEAEVTVTAAAACLELSVSAVSFGSLPLGAEDQPASPAIGITNCSTAGATLLARGGDAAGPTSLWHLVTGTASCADTLAADTYHLALTSADLPDPVALGSTAATIGNLAAGATTSHTPTIDTACPGSTGAGETMSLQITYLATE
jgi:Tol biopolymer transport system component